MTETGGKIFLSGFELEPAEKSIVSNVIRNYNRKISERIDYDYIQLRLRKSQRGKAFLHQVKGSLSKKSMLLKASSTDYNLFAALSDVLEKLLAEAIHKSRTSRQKK
jgi:ribosome-associated translation inhibitor RaiA